MSIVKSKNFSYLRGPKGDKGDRGEPGSGVSNATGRITYNASTKTIGFNDTGLVTQEYVDTSISNLVNGAPGLLDTLQELASAINDDANFFVNITSTISGKLSLSGGTMTGDITLAGAPTNNLHAATKEYVDSATSSIEITSTTDVPEGTNLYYTTDRFDTRLATKTTTNLAEGTNQYYTNTRARLAISASGDLNYDNVSGVMSYTTPFIPTDISQLTDITGLLVTTSLPDGTLVDGGDF